MSALVVASPAPAQLARQIIAQHSKSFALASKLLPPASRGDTVVLYAWCRHVDDIVDDGAGAVPAEISTAFEELKQRRRIPDVYPRELLAGMDMDARGTHYATLEDLFTYAYRVAGVVGLMMTHVLGLADDEALGPAAHLGIAMQLTNVCRDVAEDWERGRLYVPDELLGEARGLAGELGRPLPASASPALASAVRELLALADRYYRSADRGLRALPWRAALGVRSARDIYAAIGGRIARTGHDVHAGRAVVPRAAKLARVAAAALRIASGAPRRLFARQRYHIPARTLELADVARL
ncbi:MAG: phytoene/squalene synthase family protein [Myxococcales bacterium]|nr:phytoene/squalene synthase family protein [Myxococcales bacterium]